MLDFTRRYTASPVDVSDILQIEPAPPRPVAERILLYLADHAPKTATVLTRMVLAILGAHARNESGTCWPSVDRIAWCLGCSPNAASGALRKLREAGVVAKQPHPDHPDRKWVYVLRDWANYWVSLEPEQTPEQNRPTEISRGRTQNSRPSTPLPAPILDAPRHSNAPAAENAERPRRWDEERLLSDVANADEDTKEQAYACLSVGIDVPMVRWLLKRHRRGRNWIRTVVQRALKARKPAGFMVAAICGKYAAVSDVETYQHHKSRSRGPQRPTQKQDVVQEARARFFGLSSEDREAVKRWALGNYNPTTHEGRVLRRGEADSLAWLVLAQGMREVLSCQNPLLRRKDRLQESFADRHHN